MKMCVGDSQATYRYLVRCGSDEDERVRNPFSAGLMRNSSTTTAHTLTPPEGMTSTTVLLIIPKNGVCVKNIFLAPDQMVQIAALVRLNYR